METAVFLKATEKARKPRFVLAWCFFYWWKDESDWPSLANSPTICLFRAKANNSSELRLRMSWNNVKILVSFEDISNPATSQCFTIQHRLLFASFEVQLCQCNLDYLPQLSSSDRVK